MYIWSAEEGIGSPGLEVGPGIRTQIFCESSVHSSLLSYFSAPRFLFVLFFSSFLARKAMFIYYKYLLLSNNNLEPYKNVPTQGSCSFTRTQCVEAPEFACSGERIKEKPFMIFSSQR